ncbi:hypothetical protein LY02_02229 [Nonlabens ulvanivorans]|uniref:Uncharacterized protein n=1 Tax=Nonlabens ulvanivorans TaxID=906888 RepID=A0ABX5E7D2_NONUL|nr:hypothetical protein LY02_02229 [Nonlabens ulvanivorans]
MIQLKFPIILISGKESFIEHPLVILIFAVLILIGLVKGTIWLMRYLLKPIEKKNKDV